MSRNGYIPEKDILTSMVPLTIKQPRVDDRNLKMCFQDNRFTSSILPRYLRRIPSIDNLIPALSRKATLTMVFKLVIETTKIWRRLKGSEFIAHVLEFVDRELVGEVAH